MKPGIYLNERNGDLVELSISDYNDKILVGTYLCPVINEEIETEFRVCSEMLKLVFIGEV